MATIILCTSKLTNSGRRRQRRQMSFGVGVSRRLGGERDLACLGPHSSPVARAIAIVKVSCNKLNQIEANLPDIDKRASERANIGQPGPDRLGGRCCCDLCAINLEILELCWGQAGQALSTLFQVARPLSAKSLGLQAMALAAAAALTPANARAPLTKHKRGRWGPKINLACQNLARELLGRPRGQANKGRLAEAAPPHSFSNTKRGAAAAATDSR